MLLNLSNLDTINERPSAIEIHQIGETHSIEHNKTHIKHAKCHQKILKHKLYPGLEKAIGIKMTRQEKVFFERANPPFKNAVPLS